MDFSFQYVHIPEDTSQPLSSIYTTLRYDTYVLDSLDTFKDELRINSISDHDHSLSLTVSRQKVA
jgi:hypothetical protein